MIEMTFFVTKSFVNVYNLMKTLKTIRKMQPMIIVIIKSLSNMTFLIGILFINSTNSRDLPVFGQISLFFQQKSEISRF